MSTVKKCTIWLRRRHFFSSHHFATKMLFFLELDKLSYEIYPDHVELNQEVKCRQRERYYCKCGGAIASRVVLVQHAYKPFHSCFLYVMIVGLKGPLYACALVIWLNKGWVKKSQSIMFQSKPYKREWSLFNASQHNTASFVCST